MTGLSFENYDVRNSAFFWATDERFEHLRRGDCGANDAEASAAEIPDESRRCPRGDRWAGRKVLDRLDRAGGGAERGENGRVVGIGFAGRGGGEEVDLKGDGCWGEYGGVVD